MVYSDALKVSGKQYCLIKAEIILPKPIIENRRSCK